MIIDFHVHCFPDELAPKALPVLARNAGIPAKLAGTVSDIKKSMEKSQIDCSVVLSIATKPSQTEKINSWSAGIQDNQIIAFGSIHPDYSEWKAELRRVKEMGIRGLKFHPDYQDFYVDEKRLFPLYEMAFELGLIIIFHAGGDIGLPPPYKCTPQRLLRLVKAFPGGKIVAAHMGGYSYWDEVEKLLVGEDIYIDTAYSLSWMSREQARRIIMGHGCKKVLFGTDSPWEEQLNEIEKLKALDLGLEVENAIMGESARNLLNL